MRLFIRKDYKLQVAPEAYTIKAFKDLDKRDRTKDKIKLERELSFIYFVYDPRSDLQVFVDEDERIAKAIELIGLGDDFKIDPVLQKAIDVYVSLIETTASILLKDLRHGISKLRTYITTADVDDENFDKYSRALERLIPLSEKIADNERKVIKEVESIVAMRGDKALSILDGGFGDLII